MFDRTITENSPEKSLVEEVLEPSGLDRSYNSVMAEQPFTTAVSKVF